MDPEEHEPVYLRTMVACSCGEHNCASLDAFLNHF